MQHTREIERIQRRTQLSTVTQGLTILSGGVALGYGCATKHSFSGCQSPCYQGCIAIGQISPRKFILVWEVYGGITKEETLQLHSVYLIYVLQCHRRLFSTFALLYPLNNSTLHVILAFKLYSQLQRSKKVFFKCTGHIHYRDHTDGESSDREKHCKTQTIQRFSPNCFHWQGLIAFIVQMTMKNYQQLLLF